MSDRWCVKYANNVTSTVTMGVFFALLYEKTSKWVYMLSIKSLLSDYSVRLYVYLATDDTSARFLEDAENEGFTFCYRVKPTQRKAYSIFTINGDITINYMGFACYTAYQAANKVKNKPLIKITYRDILNQSK